MFCKYCGNQVPDGETCNCPDAVAARNAAAAPVATAEAAPVATAEVAPEAAAPQAAPAAGNDIGKIIGDAIKSAPAALKTLLGNSEGPGVALPAAAVLATGNLLLNILGWVCLVGCLMNALKSAMGVAAATMWAAVEKVFEGIYGYGVLGGLWTCLIPIAIAMAILVIGQLVRKEKVNLAPAFITATCVKMAPTAIFFAGALISLLIPVVGILLILVSIVTGLAADYKLLNKVVSNTNGFVGGLIAAAVVAVILGIMVWIVFGVIGGYVEGPLAKNMGGMLGGGIGDIGDLLEGLMGGF